MILMVASVLILAAGAPSPGSMSLVDWLVSGGVVMLVVEFIRGAFQRRKMGGDYAERMAAAANALVDPLSHRVRDLEKKLDECAHREDQLNEALRASRNEVRHLRSSLADANAEVRTLRRHLHRLQDMTDGREQDHEGSSG